MAGAEAGEGGGDVVAGEEEDVGGEVERRVEEGVEADEAAEADEEAEAGSEAADGRDGERGQEDVERPVAGEVGDVVDGVGVGGEAARGEEVEEPCDGARQRRWSRTLRRMMARFDIWLGLV